MSTNGFFTRIIILAHGLLQINLQKLKLWSNSQCFRSKSDWNLAAGVVISFSGTHCVPFVVLKKWLTLRESEKKSGTYF